MAPFPGASFNLSYYYVDDVCVTEDSLNCNSITVINWFNKKIGIELFPNPANNNLYVSNAQSNSIRIINIFGQQMLFKSIDTEKTNIDISGLANGIYILINEEGQRIKFLKQ